MPITIFLSAFIAPFFYSARSASVKLAPYFRIDSPVKFTRTALWISRSRIASANVASPIVPHHFSTGNWLATIVETLPQRVSIIFNRLLRSLASCLSMPQSSRISIYVAYLLQQFRIAAIRLRQSHLFGQDFQPVVPHADSLPVDQRAKMTRFPGFSASNFYHPGVCATSRFLDRSTWGVNYGNRAQNTAYASGGRGVH
jgi:hypothetical protein